jgi:hypothetical protein
VQLHALQQLPEFEFLSVASASSDFIVTLLIIFEQVGWSFQAHCALVFDCLVQSLLSVIPLQNFWATLKPEEWV